MRWTKCERTTVVTTVWGWPSVSMSQFSIFSLSPGVQFSFRGESQAVLPPRVHSHLPDENMLDWLQQGRSGDGLCASYSQSTTGTISCSIQLRTAKKMTKDIIHLTKILEHLLNIQHRSVLNKKCISWAMKKIQMRFVLKILKEPLNFLNVKSLTFPSAVTANRVCSPPISWTGRSVARASVGEGTLTFAPSIPPNWPRWLCPQP